MRTSFALAFIVFTLFSSFGQDVQWASEVLEVSSELKPVEFSAKQVLGKPNAYFHGDLHRCAWAFKAQDEEPTLKVGFEKPISAQQVVIVENVNPGAIAKVFVYDESGTKHSLKKVSTGKPGKKTRVLSVKVSIDKPIKAVEIVLDPKSVKGYNQIDAIGISTSSEEIMPQINVASDVKFEGEPEFLGATINSEHAEVLPIISPDGKTLYYVRAGHPQNQGDAEDQDIWVSKMDSEGNWQEAKPLPAPINNKFYNFIVSLSADGNTLMLGNKYQKDGSMAAGISVSKKTSSGWSFPEEVKIRDFKNKSKYEDGNLGNDGKTLIISAELDVTEGERDLYVSFLQGDGTWSKPKNLGNVLNTAEREVSPFLASDNKTLYFSSYGHAGYGYGDVFITKRLDDTWTNWSEPQNLGPSVNTESFDGFYFLTASGEYAYYSTLGEDVSRDIARIKLPVEFKPDPVVLVKGKVVNKKTGEPLETEITYEKLPEGNEVGVATSAPGTGEYQIVLPRGSQYAFHARAKGYIGVNENLDLTKLDKYNEMQIDLSMVPIEVGEVVVLNNIFFEFGHHDLMEESFPELKRMIKILTDHPDMEIEIGGHTDNVGSEVDNRNLSEKRAESVANYLKDNGAPNAISRKGYGESVPVGTNDTEEGRHDNRRVEFKILSK